MEFEFAFSWNVIDDRFDRSTYGREFMMEDLKDWYYKLSNVVKTDQGIQEPAFVFDAEHEKRRKEQLELLWNRTNEEVRLNFLLYSLLDQRRREP